MSYVYEFIGRFVVQAVWWRFGRQIQIAGVGRAVLGRRCRLSPQPQGTAGGLSPTASAGASARSLRQARTRSARCRR